VLSQKGVKVTEYKPTFQSPIMAPAASVEPGSDLVLSDLTGVEIILIQGAGVDTLDQIASKLPAQPGEVIDTGEGLLARLTPAELYLFGKLPAAKLPSAADLSDSLLQTTGLAQATDLTHGTAALRLGGSAAAEALSKICGLDFQESSFPNMQVRQTSAAKIKTLILRCDDKHGPVYHLHVNRPFGQYFWDTLWDAGQEFGIAVGNFDEPGSVEI
jgi:heterotetrameric sarcosine oxidase gamma subunit